MVRSKLLDKEEVIYRLHFEERGHNCFTYDSALEKRGNSKIVFFSIEIFGIFSIDLIVER